MAEDLGCGCGKRNKYNIPQIIMFQLYYSEAPAHHEVDIGIVMHGYIINSPFAESIIDGRILSLDCFIAIKEGAPGPGMPQGQYHEFGYQFSLSSEWGGTPVLDIDDRNVVKTYLPKGCQQQAIDTVRVCCQKLVRYVKPSILFRRTNVPHLPPGAMRKYDLVTSAIHDVGYETRHHGTDDMGHRFWVMRPALPALTPPRGV